MKPKTRRRIGMGLIAIGLLILLALGIYEASAYPWRMLFAQWGWTEQQTVEALPEPAPLPDFLLRPPQESAPPSPEVSEEPEVALEDAEQVFTRPAVDLTVLGTVKIPKISMSEHLVAGTGNEMYYGIGHESRSALPGQPGNCVLAGHRNLIVAHPFRHLDKLVEGDEIYVTYGEETYCYQVYQTLTVEPTETWVMYLQEGETAMVTLITCTPAFNPTHRLIVWGRLVTDEPETTGEPEVTEEIPSIEEPETTDEPAVTGETPSTDEPEITDDVATTDGVEGADKTEESETISE